MATKTKTKKKAAITPSRKSGKKPGAGKAGRASRTSGPSGKFGPNTVLRPSRDVITRNNPNGSVVLMSLEDSDSFHVIDGIAAEVWQSLDGKKSVRQIEQEMVERFNPPVARFRKDMEGFLKDLAKKKLVEPRSKS